MSEERSKAATYLDGVASAMGMVVTPFRDSVVAQGVRMGAELLRTIAGGIRAGRMDRDALRRVIDEHATIREPDYSEADKAYERRMAEDDTDPGKPSVK